MSLIVAVKCAGGVVLAGDGRKTLTGFDPAGERPALVKYATQDYEQKVFVFDAPHDHVAIGVSGKFPPIVDITRERLAQFLFVQSEAQKLGAAITAALPPQRASVAEYAEVVHGVLVRDAPDANVLLGGFDEREGASVWDIGSQSGPVEHHAGAFGVSWRGQRQIVDRLLLGLEPSLRDEDGNAADARVPLPLATMTLAHAAEFATFLIRTTADVWRLLGEYSFACVGGPVDVVTIDEANGARSERTGAVEPLPVVLEWKTRPDDELTVDVVAPRDLWQSAALTMRPVTVQERERQHELAARYDEMMRRRRGVSG